MRQYLSDIYHVRKVLLYKKYTKMMSLILNKLLSDMEKIITLSDRKYHRKSALTGPAGPAYAHLPPAC
jgi:hypothetical protein